MEQIRKNINVYESAIRETTTTYTIKNKDLVMDIKTRLSSTKDTWDGYSVDFRVFNGKSWDKIPTGVTRDLLITKYFKHELINW
jgi:hypothetical protein